LNPSGSDRLRPLQSRHAGIASLFEGADSIRLNGVTSTSFMQSAPGPETTIDGVPYLYFGGTSYLGLAAHPEVIEAGCEALRAYGVHSATTRARFGTNPPVHLVEQRAAEFFATEDAFYFGSGYAGMHMLAAAFATEADAVAVEDGAHYCVLEAARATGLPVFTFSKSDPAALAAHAEQHRRFLVMADAVSPSDGSVAPIAEYLHALQSCDRAHLLLDDAHGIGILGLHGRGLAEEAGLWATTNTLSGDSRVTLCICGTLAKALGGFGGIIPGTRLFVERVRKATHVFDGASAPASAEAGATAKALQIVIQHPELRERVRANSTHLRRGLRALGLSVPDTHTAHFGVVIGDRPEMERIHRELKARRIMVPYVGAYTGIPAEGLLRFAVFANHTSAQLDHLLAELRAIL
jgi:8-amino-7-oxononanoate synthase